MDGCNPMHIFCMIGLPLSKAAPASFGLMFAVFYRKEHTNYKLCITRGQRLFNFRMKLRSVMKISRPGVRLHAGTLPQTGKYSSRNAAAAEADEYSFSIIPLWKKGKPFHADNSGILPEPGVLIDFHCRLCYHDQKVCIPAAAKWQAASTTCICTTAGG